MLRRNAEQAGELACRQPRRFPQRSNFITSQWTHSPTDLQIPMTTSTLIAPTLDHSYSIFITARVGRRPMSTSPKSCHGPLLIKRCIVTCANGALQPGGGSCSIYPLLGPTVNTVADFIQSQSNFAFISVLPLLSPMMSVTSTGVLGRALPFR